MNIDSLVTIGAAILSSVISVGVPIGTGLVVMYGKLCKLEAFVKTYVKMKEGDEL